MSCRLPVLAPLLLALPLLLSCSDDAPRGPVAEGLDPDVEARVDRLLDRMTLEEKVEQKHGSGGLPFGDVWGTPANDRLGIPGFAMLDGPRGVSKVAGEATAFPVAMARGATWDVELERRIAEAVAVECAAKGCNVLLAPAINILRHPRWGRAQEVYGEDVHHMTRFGVAFVEGAQQHVLASAKHYAANSIEDTRYDVSVEIDERTLREIYLPHFRAVVKEANIASIMTAYNRVNGVYCSENEPLLDILKDEWGFHGFVESDWIDGTLSTIPAAEAGLDIEMPSPVFFGDELVAAVESGEVSMDTIDASVRRVLRRKLEYGLDDPPAPPDASVVESSAHRALAHEAARKSMVLLKNEAEALPLDRADLTSVVVAGHLADVENLGDDGSSDVSPSTAVTPLAGLQSASGGAAVTPVASEDVLETADEAAVSAADAAVVVVGLTSEDESEYINIDVIGSQAGDREGLALSPEHVALIQDVAALNPRTIVVLEGGSAITVESWLADVEAVVMAWYPGMEGGAALAELLFGDASFSGKLPFTVPQTEDQLPPFDNTSLEVPYGHFHGYRHVDRNDTTPRFPFGYGLSYTSFAYENLQLEADVVGPEDTVRVTFEVTNTGPVPGDEVVQLYVGYEGSSVERSVRELKGFDRVSLMAGETKTVTMEVPVRDLAYWDAGADDWIVEPIEYGVQVGTSSRDLPLEASFTVTS
ncbi:MAG: beta-glucosidase family protein [Myxococcota bacterium]